MLAMVHTADDWDGAVAVLAGDGEAVVSASTRMAEDVRPHDVEAFQVQLELTHPDVCPRTHHHATVSPIRDSAANPGGVHEVAVVESYHLSARTGHCGDKKR